MDQSVKLDLYYTDPFIDKVQESNGIQLASKAEIVATKLDVVQRTGSKKDFWDIDRLKDDFTITQMFELHKKKVSLHPRAGTAHRKIYRLHPSR